MKKNKRIIIHPSFPSFEMILVEGGVFSMGDDQGQYDSEKPAHEVKLSSFYIGKYPVTQELWKAISGKNPSGFKGEKRPVENVSWMDTQKFIKKLNKKTGELFRLPTEAEWEYAARGGRYSQSYWYAGSDKLRQVGWYGENSNLETKEVGQLRPNELELYDMSGNVWEWCEDWFDEKYYQKCKGKGLVENPVNFTKATLRVLRGGSYFLGPIRCRSTNRRSSEPGHRSDLIGFRLVLPLQSVGKPEGIP